MNPNSLVKVVKVDSVNEKFNVKIGMKGTVVENINNPYVDVFIKDLGYRRFCEDQLEHIEALCDVTSANEGAEAEIVEVTDFDKVNGLSVGMIGRIIKVYEYKYPLEGQALIYVPDIKNPVSGFCVDLTQLELVNKERKGVK